MTLNPILALLKTLLLFLTLRVNFIGKDVGRTITMEDGQTFRIFRHVRIRAGDAEPPEGVFIVRFKPLGMTIHQNIWFSWLPMMILMGFNGFREKYWCVDDETGLCQGIYAWRTLEDTQYYSKSNAMQFMTRRSDPKSISARVLDQSTETYWLFECHSASTADHTKGEK